MLDLLEKGKKVLLALVHQPQYTRKNLLQLLGYLGVTLWKLFLSCWLL